ncbi:STAS domain-containing protein [Thermopolyspora sp. NPDC052614]|uniref:STAS domain-containing protein n=1 Tax=Thermopolyspora sp. NPDC052614 TaxID=3155682 RepID=UPI003442EC54
MTNPPAGGTSAALVLSSEVIDRDGGRIPVVRVEGILDATTRDGFARFLAEIDDEHGPGMILDLSGVTFMDSRALGLIVHHWQRSTAAGGDYALVGVRYQYCKVMWVTGLADRLPMRDTVADALAGFHEF